MQWRGQRMPAWKPHPDGLCAALQSACDGPSGHPFGRTVIASSKGKTVLKILVPVKRAVDYNVRVRAKADGSGLDIANAKMAMNPFDEIAVEEAVRLKEAGVATEVVAVSCGVGACLGCVSKTTENWPVPAKRGGQVQVCNHGPVFWSDQIEL